jgi:hypothetical protein
VEEELPDVGVEEDRDALKFMMAQWGAPAFVVREANVRLAWEKIANLCQKQRDEWLSVVRVRLGRLRALAGDWCTMVPLLGAEQVQGLEHLHAELRPQLRLPVAAASSERELRRAVVEFADAATRFNARWARFLPTIDLSTANDLRDKYNRYYLVEKECVVRSPQVARRGFTSLQPLTVDDLYRAFPLLLVPELLPT